MPFASPTAWDPAKTSVNISIDLLTDNYVSTVTGSDNNFFYYTSKAGSPMLATAGSGRFYWEVEITGTWDNVNTFAMVGVAQVGDPVEPTNSLNIYDDNAVLRSDGRLFTGDVPSGSGGFLSGDVIGILCDVNNESIYWYKNGVYLTSIYGNLNRTVAYYPVWGTNKQGVQAIIHDGIKGEIARNLNLNENGVLTLGQTADHYSKFVYNQAGPSTYYGFRGLDGDIEPDEHRAPERELEKSTNDKLLSRECITPFDPSVRPGNDPVFWDAFQSNASLSFTDRDLVVNGMQAVAAKVNSPRYFGFWYCELKILDGGDDLSFGVATADAPTGSAPGFNNQSWALYSGGTGRLVHNSQLLASNLDFTNGDTVQIAMDCETGNVWFGVNNTWVNGGDPAARLNPSFPSLPTDGVGLYVTVGSNSIQAWSVRGCFYREVFQYVTPGNFDPLDLTFGPQILIGKDPEAFDPDSLVQDPGPGGSGSIEFDATLTTKDVLLTDNNKGTDFGELTRYEPDYVIEPYDFSKVKTGFRVNDPYKSNVVFQLTGRNGFNDDSLNNRSIITNDGVQLTSVNGLFGPGVDFEENQETFLEYAHDDGLNFGSGDFTIECWANVENEVSHNMVLLEHQGDNVGSTNSAWRLIRLNSGDAYAFEYRTAGNELGANISVTSTTNTGPGVWDHVAVVRLGNTITIYINGVAEASVTETGSLLDSTQTLYVGNDVYDPNPRGFDGVLSDIRITKGVARYIGNFRTSDNAFNPIFLNDPYYEKTALFLKFDGINGSKSFCDESLFNHTITSFNNAALSSNTSVSGNTSLLLNGTNQYVQIPHDNTFNLGGGDWTIEVSVFPENGGSANQRVLSKDNASANGFSPFIIQRFGNQWAFYASSNGSVWDIAFEQNFGTVAVGVWQTLTIIRRGTQIEFYVNGRLTKTVAALGSIYSNTDPLRIGRYVTALEHFKGYVDNVRITRDARYDLEYIIPPVTSTDPYLVTNGTVPAGMTLQGTAQIVSPPASTFSGSPYVIQTFGVSNYARIDDTPVLNIGTEAFTVDFNFYVPTGTALGGFFEEQGSGGGNPKFYCYFNSLTQIGVHINGGFGGNQFLNFNIPTFTFDEWHNFRVTRFEGTVSVYYDFQLIGTITGNPADSFPSDTSWNFGRTSEVAASMGNLYFDGIQFWIGQAIAPNGLVAGNGIATDDFDAICEPVVCPTVEVQTTGDFIKTFWDDARNDFGLITNNKLTIRSNQTGSRSATTYHSVSSGKYYFEFTVDNAGGPRQVGFMVPGITINSINQDPNSFELDRTNWTNGDVVGVALDMDTRQLWYSVNGVWVSGADPDADDPGVVTGFTGAEYAFAVGHNSTLFNSTTGQITCNFGQSAFTYPVPNGFLSGFGVFNTDPFYQYTEFKADMEFPFANDINGQYTEGSKNFMLGTFSSGSDMTQVKSAYGEKAYLGDATGDSSMVFQVIPGTAFGTDDFTLEAWVNFYGTNGGDLFSTHLAGSTSGWRFPVSPTAYAFRVTQLDTIRLQGTWNIPLNEWHHIACTRKSGTLRVFLDGVLVGSGPSTDNISNNGQPLSMGGPVNPTFATNFTLKAYIDNARIMKGFARYTEEFLPGDFDEPITFTTDNDVATPTTWDASRSVGMLIDNNDRSATSVSNGGYSATTFFSANSGKWYMEFFIDVLDSNNGFGLREAGLASAYMGYTANTWFFTGGGLVVEGSVVTSSGHITWTQGDTVMFAIDLDNNGAYWGVNGTWDTGHDPTIGEPPSYTFANLTYEVGYNRNGGSPSEVTGNWGQDPFLYTVPTGYAAGFGEGGRTRTATEVIITDPTEWDPTRATNTQLSNANRTALNDTTGNYSVPTSFAERDGKWYVELFINNQQPGQRVGLRQGGLGNISLGDVAGTLGWEPSGLVRYRDKNNNLDTVTIASWTTNDYVQIALDLETNGVYLGVNGNWSGHDPNAGDAPTFTLDEATFYEIAHGNTGGVGTGNGTATINAGHAAFTQPVPTGFAAGFGASITFRESQDCVCSLTYKNDEVDPNFNDLVLLIQSTDTSMPKNLAPVNTTVESEYLMSTAETKWAQQSMEIFADPQKISITPISNEWNFGTDPFTIEMWIKPSNTAFSLMEIEPLSNGFELFTSSQTLRINSTAFGTETIAGRFTIESNIWQHIALVSENSNLTVFVNGEIQGSLSSFSDDGINPLSLPAITPTKIWFGGRAGNTELLNGWIDSIRVYKGIAKYKDNFPCPNRPFGNKPGTPSDVSFDQTYGDPIFDQVAFYSRFNNSTTDLSPVSTTQSAQSNVGFDGLNPKFGSHALSFSAPGGYLKYTNQPEHSFGSNDFTIEAWIRPTTLGAGTIASVYTSSGNNRAWFWRISPSAVGELEFFYQTSGPYSYTIYSENAGLEPGVWQHVAVSRIRDKLRMFVGGKIVSEETVDFTMNTTTATLDIGAIDQTISPFVGAIDDLRITNGTGRYDIEFTPANFQKSAALFEHPISITNTEFKSGKWYWEVTYTGGENFIAGIVDETVDITKPISVTDSAWYIEASTVTAFGPNDYHHYNAGRIDGNLVALQQQSMVPGDIMTFAYDTMTGNLWMGYKDSTTNPIYTQKWIRGIVGGGAPAEGDPSTGANPTFTDAPIAVGDSTGYRFFVQGDQKIKTFDIVATLESIDTVIGPTPTGYMNGIGISTGTGATVYEPCWDNTANTDVYIYSLEDPAGCFTNARNPSSSNQATWADSDHPRGRGNGLIAGAWYLEFDVETIANTQSAAIGFATSANWSVDWTDYRNPGAGPFGRENLTNGWFTWFMSTGNGAPWSFGSIGSNGTLMIGIDIDNNEVRIGRNGTWDQISSLSNDLISQFRTQGAIIGAEIWDGNQLTLKKTAEYLYSPPAGYTAGWGGESAVVISNIVLTNNNRTATGTGTVDATYKIFATETTKIYTEFTVDFADMSSLIGIGVKNDNVEYLYQSDGAIGKFNAGPEITYNPADADAGVGFFNDDTTVFMVNIGRHVRSTRGQDTGKYYWESSIDFVDGTGNGVIGISTSAADITMEPGFDAEGWGIRENGNIYHNGVIVGSVPAYTQGDVVSFAFDADSGNLWYGLNGTFVGDPVVGISPDITGISGEIFVSAGYASGTGGSGFAVTTNFGPYTYFFNLPTSYCAFGPEGPPGTMPTYQQGDTIGVAIDPNTCEVWWVLNGDVIFGGEPENNIGAITTLDKTICLNVQMVSGQVTINMGDEPFVADAENAYLVGYEAAGCGDGGFYPEPTREFTPNGLLYPFSGTLTRNRLVWDGSQGIAPTVYDPATSNAGMIITNGGLTINQPGGGTTAGGTAVNVSSGKYYWEVFVDTGPGAIQVGARRGFGTTQLGLQSGGIGWIADGRIQFSGGIINGNPTYTVGDTLMFALDMDTKQFWIGKNGTWQVSHDPTLGQPGIITGLINAYGPAVGNGASGSSGNWKVTGNFGQNPFTYSPPTGFNAGIGGIISSAESVISGNLSTTANVYAEFTVLEHEFNGYIRIGDERYTDGRICDSLGCGLQSYTDWVTGDVINFASNSNSQYWLGINGVWLFGGNPVSGLNPTSAFSNGESLAVGLDNQNPGTSRFKVEFNAGLRPFSYPIPSGYAALEPLIAYVGTGPCGTGVGPQPPTPIANGLDTVNILGLYRRSHEQHKSTNFVQNPSVKETGFTIWSEYVDFNEIRNTWSKLSPIVERSIEAFAYESSNLMQQIFGVPFDQLILGYAHFEPRLDSFDATTLMSVKNPHCAYMFVLGTDIHDWGPAPQHKTSIQFVTPQMFHQLGVITIPFFYTYGNATGNEAPIVADPVQMFETGYKLSIIFSLQELPKSHVTIKRDAGQIISMGFSKVKIQINSINASGFMPSFFAAPCLVRPDFQKITIGTPQYPPIETGRVNGNTL